MDTITHTVLGAAVGEVILGKKIGKKAMLWGAVFSNFPDIDVASHFFMDPIDGLLAHRGFTHSILFSCLLIPLMTFLFFNIYKKYSTTYFDWIKLFSITLFSHLFLDSLTSYGTGLLEPFSHQRFSFNTIFVADPFYTFPLLVCTIALLILKNQSKYRKAWTNAGLIISSMYIIFTFINKYHVDKVMDNSLKNQKHSYSKMMTTPTPLNNILWNSIAKNDSGYWIGYYSLLDRKEEVNYFFIRRNDSLISNEIKEPNIQKLIRFSQGYYCITQEDNINYFHDLRFGETGSWDNEESKFTFSYRLGENQDESMFLQKGRLQGPLKETFSKLLERIKGR
jgi:inner membrane protein